MDDARARGWPVLTRLLYRFLRPYAAKAGRQLQLGEDLALVPEAPEDKIRIHAALN